jgi:PAS domain S-box-containing protein
MEENRNTKFKSLSPQLPQLEWHVLAEVIPQLVWSTRADGYSDYFNHRWFTYTGLEGEALTGWQWTKALHPEDLERTNARWKFAVQSADIYEIEYRLRRHDGMYRWHLARGLPVRDDSGTILRWFGTCTDIDEHRQTEAALRKTEGELQRVLASVSDYLWSAEVRGGKFQYLFYSSAVEKITGRPVEYYLAGPERWLSTIHPEDRKWILREFEQAKAGLVDRMEREYRIFWPDGSQRWVRDSVEITRTSPNYLRMDGVVSDITERRAYEHRLEGITEDLERSNEELERFASIASHDMKEPLRTVASYVSLLSVKYAKKLDKRAEEYIGYATDGCKRMAALIDDLLTYSQAGNDVTTLLPTDLNAVLATVRTNLKVALEESNAVLTTDPLPIVNGNHQLLLQVFQNLINNGIKFRSQAAPQIHIAAQRQENDWVLAIQDNGIGFDMKYNDAIFQIFQRLNPREKYSGSGIGLAVCKKIIERLKGKIWARSEKGKGATFYLSLPVEIKS